MEVVVEEEVEEKATWILLKQVVSSSLRPHLQVATSVYTSSLGLIGGGGGGGGGGGEGYLDSAEAGSQRMRP